jgi:cell division protein FtsW (lipid II flippase)
MELDMKTSQADIQKQVRGHLAVAAGLLTLTVVTVGIAQLDLGTTTRVVIALAIAAVQGGLIVGYPVLIFTGIFVAGLLLLSVAAHFDTIEGVKHLVATTPGVETQDGGGQ